MTFEIRSLKHFLNDSSFWRGYKEVCNCNCFNYILDLGYHRIPYRLRISNKYGNLTRNKFLTKSVTSLK
jgi:hypothetical protein